MIRVIVENQENLGAYESVSIGFEVRSRVNLDVLRTSGGRTIEELPVTPWWKDYDACEEDRPTRLPTRFDFTNWLIVAAVEGEERLGGMIVARDCPECEMLEGRTDLAVIFDARVGERDRGHGIGWALFGSVKANTKHLGCTELRVETQDVNVGACRFYRAMGCLIHSIELGAYGPEIDEAKLIWSIPL